MKTLVDNTYADIIINHSPAMAAYDVWVDKEKKIAHLKNVVKSISIYSLVTVDENGRQQITTVNLSENDVNQLYKKLKELKEADFVGEYETDDLPF